MRTISYLGPRNTFTEKAAKFLSSCLDKDSELKEAVSNDAVTRSVAEKHADMGVIPCYNYLEGLVQESLDLIYENDLKIKAMQRLSITLSAGKSGDGEDIYSHPKALAQCSEWLWKNYRESMQIPETSTSAAARRVASSSGIAIAGIEALKENNLEIIAQDIGNRKNRRKNFTDFYLVARENGEAYDDQKEYLTMVAVTPHVDKPGLLADILQQIAYHDLNNAKIHSRPALDDVAIEGLEPQMFYIEIVAHQAKEDFRRCIDSLKYKLTPKGKDIETVRVLGSYEKP